ncbi:MAG: putative toxin-antitoxin system toxin component, PIN family [Acidobacteriota bacterium]|nr:putative toxin-antitoxin system toxin component, PIN family [Acidobacteriota bacterium]
MGEKKAGMTRVVLDTNVLVSALLFRGPLNRLIILLEEGRIGLLISREVFLEYLRVLSYPKFGLDTKEIRGLLENHILPFSEMVNAEPMRPVIPEDPDDDKFLALAETGRADYLVSGDRHLLALGRFGKIPIVTARDFLESIGRS